MTYKNTKAGHRPAFVHYEYAITKRSDIYAKTASCEKSVRPQNGRGKKDVKSKVVAKKNDCNNKILPTIILVNLVPSPSEAWRMTHKFT